MLFGSLLSRAEVALIVQVHTVRNCVEAACGAEFTTIFKALGFKFVTLDLEGFRSGSMNSLLPAEQLRRTG